MIYFCFFTMQGFGSGYFGHIRTRVIIKLGCGFIWGFGSGSVIFAPYPASYFVEIRIRIRLLSRIGSGSVFFRGSDPANFLPDPPAYCGGYGILGVYKDVSFYHAVRYVYEWVKLARASYLTKGYLLKMIIFALFWPKYAFSCNTLKKNIAIT